MSDNPTTQWIHDSIGREISATEHELREQLAKRVERAILTVFPNGNRTAGQRGPDDAGNATIISRLAVGVFVEFIQEGQRVRQLHDDGGISWH